MKKVLTSANKPDSKTKQAYGELFRALLQIPDRDVQQRIMEAINGKSSEQLTHTLCSNCKNTSGGSLNSKRLVDASSQTDSSIRVPPLLAPNKSAYLSQQKNEVGRNASLTVKSPVLINSTLTSKSQMINAVEAPKGHIRKRKRKVCLPQVVKRSHAQIVQSQKKPKMKKQKVEMEPRSDSTSQQKAIEGINDRNDLFAVPDSLLDEIISMPSPVVMPQKSQDEHILRVMKKEFLECNIRLDGLLPIHRAVIDSDSYILQRQIFVWKMCLKRDLNDLLTDDDESCLHLAVVNNSYPKIIQVLLDSGLNVNEIYSASNNCIHLAVLNDIDRTSMHLLMQRIDLPILLQLNDDGYTPLHIAVRKDSFLLAEIILTVLDERLGCKILYEGYADKKKTKLEFSKYYEGACRNLKDKYGSTPQVNKLKRQLLNCGDRRSGNTALFFAIENRLEHFVFLLLAHLTNPRIQNFNGNDAKSYYSEFGRALNLSLKVDSAFESVINIIGCDPEEN